MHKKKQTKCAKNIKSVQYNPWVVEKNILIW